MVKTTRCNDNHLIHMFLFLKKFNYFVFLLVIVFINLLLTLFLIKESVNSDNNISTPHFLQASEELQKAYLDALVYCGEQNYSHRGEDIYCMNKQIESDAPAEIKTYKRIKQFCRIKENNECDVDNCITNTIIYY